MWCDGMVWWRFCDVMLMMAWQSKKYEIQIHRFRSMWVSLSVCGSVEFVRCVCEMYLWDVSVFSSSLLPILPFRHFSFSQIFSQLTRPAGGSELGISVNHAWNWNLIPTWIIFSTKSFRGIWFRAPLAKRQKRVENELYRIWQPQNLLSLASSRIVLSEPRALSSGRWEDGRVLLCSIKMRCGVVIQPIRSVDCAEGM
jgi:hypothetical protein